MAAAVLVSAAPGRGGFDAPVAKRGAPFAYIYTGTPRYEPKAWLDGRDRFPEGARLQLVRRNSRRLLAPGFFASADAFVSYDARRVLLSAKRTVADRWQIFEIELDDGPARQLTEGDADCIRPLYLPDGGFVYTRIAGQDSSIMLGPKTARLTFAPGRYLTDDVLQDGRILFETNPNPGARELYTVYPDGTGVESVRCDHGPDRGEARQIASGDYIFNSGKRLARITSALAAQTDIVQPNREPGGPIAEVSSDVWIVGLRRMGGNIGLYEWNAAKRETKPIEKPRDSAVEPVIVAPRTPPRQFPSALLPTRTAGNLLCLNARESREQFEAKSVHWVRFYSQAGPLGQTEIAPDGSFYVQVPGDQPIRIELADASGRIVAAEHNWFWMRPAEQRICVGCHVGPERAPENKVPDILLRTIVPVQMLEARRP